MDLDEARRQALALFPALGPARDCPLIELGRREGSGLGFFEQLSAMTPRGFPYPGLLLFGLTELLGLRDSGPDEKLRWRVGFSLRGATFRFELRKFGLRMLCEPEHLEQAITREVLGKARALTGVAERHLSASYAMDQIRTGLFTMGNLHETLDTRYRFLREQAALAYAKPPPPPETGESDGVTWHRHDVSRPAREGGALGTAAVDAYFSRLEHLFCIAAAFQPESLQTQAIVDFLGSNWTNKARTILDLQDPVAKSFYDKLLDVKDEWRNPLAHGGFLSGGGSLYFHLPRIGALPARMRKTPDGVRLGFTLHASSFDELMQLFDSFDAFLNSGALRHALRWAEAGLNVAFDPASRADYATAAESDSAMTSLIEWTQQDIDRHTNMDY